MGEQKVVADDWQERDAYLLGARRAASRFEITFLNPHHQAGHETMSRPAQSSNGGSSDHSYFEQQRNILIGQIGEVRDRHAAPPFTTRADTRDQSMEQVLQNLNKLNRSLEGMTAVRFFNRRDEQHRKADRTSTGWQRILSRRGPLVALRECHAQRTRACRRRQDANSRTDSQQGSSICESMSSIREKGKSLVIQG